MDGATDGAVLMSFGSIAKSSEMSPDLKEIFTGAFKSMPNLKFLWKYESENDPLVEAPNIIKKKWLPQNDLLYHPNLRVFITHCGLNSLFESAYAGVPLICIPLFGDQLRNAKIVEKRGISISLHKNTLSSMALKTAINEIMLNDK
ncbi:unnamed protein product [Gongylonema pulchrum]|uniref:UDP-glucuronosyltransferase n=1 Tax=Gongylonema pulchrum TaxID=637853 RepID=A0A183EQD1_9BILA|nr:unnamed protein product [Gongylonema pulchrum]